MPDPRPLPTPKRKAVVPSAPSELEATFRLQMRFESIPPWETEYRFDEVRLWRFDFAWPRPKVAVEIEGGTRIFGRHNRAEGFRKDCEKYNAATFSGWQVYRFTAEMVNDGSAVKLIKEVLG